MIIKGNCEHLERRRTLSGMPTYFFHVYDGLGNLAPESIEFADHEAARIEALRTAGAMIADLAQSWPTAPWEMEVRDETGVTIARLRFSAAP